MMLTDPVEIENALLSELEGMSKSALAKHAKIFNVPTQSSKSKNAFADCVADSAQEAGAIGSAMSAKGT